MEIKVHGGGSETTTPTEPAEGNGVQALTKTAAQAFLSQRYGPAASAYERAISAGGDGASLYERLGQCYERLGRKSDAVSAYERGLQLSQQAANSGKIDKDKAATRIDRYRSHLKTLGN